MLAVRELAGIIGNAVLFIVILQGILDGFLRQNRAVDLRGRQAVQSLSDYNTMEEMDHILTVVPQIVQLLRNMSPVWRDLQTGKRTYIL